MASPRSALLVIDMINRFDFDGGRALARAAAPASRRIAWLCGRFRTADWPVVLVNDNFMDWKADFREICAVCSQDGMEGAEIARRLAPVPGDYFVLKPRHSAFHASPLDALLESLDVDRLVITGVATDACVLATALDAHMRDYALAVPRGCVASITPPVATARWRCCATTATPIPAARAALRPEHGAITGAGATAQCPTAHARLPRVDPRPTHRHHARPRVGAFP